MTAITDILLTHHLTLHADDDTNDWHATCSCGADLGHCEDTWEGQKIQAAHVAHLIDPDDREYTPAQRREADRSMAAMSGLIDHVAIQAEDVRLADGTALIVNGAINSALLPSRPYPSANITGLRIPIDQVICDPGYPADQADRRDTTEESVPVGGRDLKLKPSDRSRKLGERAVHIPALLHLIEQPGRDGHLLVEVRILAVDDSGTVGKDELESAEFHDDSSTGDGPAATGPTDSVEVTARRGDDSGPGELGELAQAWRDVVTDYAAGRLQVTVSSSDADTHWCRLHRLMQAHTGEARS